ncbi:MAG: site-specific integrase [Dehalococcoidia bacterium]|nr:site-specific integrase [Dehalococcoidia bacterium]
MRGRIVKRYEDSWTIVVDIGRDPQTGKRKQMSRSIKGTKKEAEKRLAEIIHQLEKGTFTKPQKITFGEYLHQWLKNHSSKLGPRTIEDYELDIRKHILPSLGAIYLSQLKPQHLEDYYAEKLEHGRCDGKGGLSPKTIRNHHHIIHAALQKALTTHLIQVNPADAVELPEKQHYEFPTWDENEVNKFLEAIKNSPYYTIFYLALFTGARRSEVLALRWQDTNLTLGQIQINRSLHRLKGGKLVFRPTKTKRSRRTIALSPSTIITLRNHKEAQRLEWNMADRNPTEETLVFCHFDGTPLVPDTVTHAWQRVLKQAGVDLKRIRMHDARHSHASLLLKQGVHPKIVQERLGHSSISMTLDTYSHVMPGLQEAAAKGFDGILQEPKTEVLENLRDRNVIENKNSPHQKTR